MDKILFRLAMWLPKRLVYFCLIRCISYGTTGRYSIEVVQEVTAMDILDRWYKQNREVTR